MAVLFQMLGRRNRRSRRSKGRATGLPDRHKLGTDEVEHSLFIANFSIQPDCIKKSAPVSCHLRLFDLYPWFDAARAHAAAGATNAYGRWLL